jgi:hypothetical protein
MVEESFLPMRLINRESFGEFALQKANPLSQDKGDIAADKYMYVIGHENISTNCDASRFTDSSERDKSAVNFLVGQ